MENKYDHLIGKQLLVKTVPNFWCSIRGGNFPLDLDFPKVISLTSIVYFPDSEQHICDTYSGLCEEGYGWNVESLLEVSKIPENNDSKIGKFILVGGSYVRKVEDVKTFSEITMLLTEGGWYKESEVIYEN